MCLHTPDRPSLRLGGRRRGTYGGGRRHSALGSRAAAPERRNRTPVCLHTPNRPGLRLGGGAAACMAAADGTPRWAAQPQRRRGGIQPLCVSTPHDLKSCPSTSPTHPGISAIPAPGHIGHPEGPQQPQSCANFSASADSVRLRRPTGHCGWLLPALGTERCGFGCRRCTLGFAAAAETRTNKNPARLHHNRRHTALGSTAAAPERRNRAPVCLHTPDRPSLQLGGRRRGTYGGGRRHSVLGSRAAAPERRNRTPVCLHTPHRPGLRLGGRRRSMHGGGRRHSVLGSRAAAPERRNPTPVCLHTP